MTFGTARIDKVESVNNARNRGESPSVYEHTKLIDILGHIYRRDNRVA